ncbi:hypothetical protein KIN20_033986, partial [Parelaphostrongylus tenuis]
MLEVATGIDCSQGGIDGYPIPPIDAALPEKVMVYRLQLGDTEREKYQKFIRLYIFQFPMLMQVPHFDPMASCIDLDIEKGFQMA